MGFMVAPHSMAVIR